MGQTNGTLAQGLGQQMAPALAQLQGGGQTAMPTGNVLGQLLNGQQGGFPQPVGIPQRQYLPGFGAGTQIGQVQGPPSYTPPTPPPGTTPPTTPGTTPGLPPGVTADQYRQLQHLLYQRQGENPFMYALRTRRSDRQLDPLLNQMPSWYANLIRGGSQYNNIMGPGMHDSMIFSG